MTAPETAGQAAYGPLRCPACGSPEPRLHPAVSGGGEVTRLCADPFHGAIAAAAPAPAAARLSESQQFQVSEARDILGTWDLNNPGGVSRETVLADQVRALLAIVDQLAAAAPAGTGAPASDMLGVAVQALREISEAEDGADASTYGAIAASALGIIDRGTPGELRWDLVPRQPQAAPGTLRDLAEEVIAAYVALVSYDETPQDRSRVAAWRARLEQPQAAPELAAATPPLRNERKRQ